MTFPDDVGDTLYIVLLSTQLPTCVSLYRVSFGRYRPLKLPLSCEVVEKGGFWAPGLYMGYTPDFGHAFSNRIHFREYGRFWLSSVQRAGSLGGT